jgi:DNA polymerase III sliding clamp (beta) subunit (PCNA family)
MITIQQENLSDALNTVTRASLKNSVMPAFALVKLDASVDGKVSLSCFNGETAARAIVYAACSDDLSVCVDAQTLKAVTDTLSGEIQLSVTDKSVVIQNGAHRTILRLIEETIPVIGEESAGELLLLSGATFRSLARVIPFASADEARPALQVLHLSFSEQGVSAQAADGFTAAIVVENVAGVKEQTSIPLPLGFAKLLAALVEERDTLKVQSAGANRFVFEITHADTGKHLTLATVTPGNSFPAQQISQLIRDARDGAVAHLRVQKLSLAQTVKMVSAMGTQTTFFKAVNGTVKVASAETETGQARNVLEGSASGEDATVWLSAAFIKRAVEACKGEIVIQLGGDKKPALFEEGNFTAILMAMIADGNKDPFPNDEEAIAISLDMLAVPA